MPKDALNIDVDGMFQPEFKADSFVPFTHTDTCYGRFKGSQSFWYRKGITNENRARLEFLAQEFFRLIASHQPETRAIHAPVQSQNSPSRRSPVPFYVFSETIRGFSPLPALEYCASQVYKSFGKILLVALFLEEIDLKNGNIGLNEEGRVCKIDGDLCFASLILPEKYPQDKSIITTATIEALPQLTNDYPYNWLDIRKEGKNSNINPLFAQEISKHPDFRQEINEAILSILLCPETYIQNIIKACCPNMELPLNDFFQTRREQLRTSALGSESFISFLQTPAAKQQAINSFSEMLHFTLQGQQTILEDSPSRSKFLHDYNIRAQGLLGQSLAHALTIASLTSPSSVQEIAEDMDVIRISKTSSPSVQSIFKQSVTPPIEAPKAPTPTSRFGSIFAPAAAFMRRIGSSEDIAPTLK